MEDNKKLKYTYYTAGAIEKATDNQMVSWRNELKDKLKFDGVIQYDPVERESQKTGKPSREMVKYISGLKQGGHWDLFIKAMDKIWWGIIRAAAGNFIDVLIFLRNRKIVDGNEERDLTFWSDFEAVVRSDFIIALMLKNVQTIGTIGEILVAYLFRIPIYLILPDQSKTECNSTLLYWVLESGGEVFYSTRECADYIKDKYKFEEKK
jgi:hypothetical protein